MKKLKLITILLLASIGAMGQNTNGTLQRQIASPNAISGLFGSIRDSLYTRAQIRALVATATPDSTVFRTVANSYSLAGMQTKLNGYQALLSGTGLVKSTAGTISYITDNSTNWNTAFSQTRQWDGSSTGLVAATGRTSLGGTTVGQNFFTLTNPSAITFPRINADNTVDALSASAFRTAIGAGSGTVTSVTGTANQITVTGTTAPVLSIPSTLIVPGTLQSTAGAVTLAANTKIGSIEYMSAGVNNNWFGDNIYYDSPNFRYRANGFGTLFYIYNGQFLVRTAPSGLAGAVATTTNRFSVLENGDVGVGGNMGTSTGTLTGAALKVTTGGVVTATTSLNAPLVNITGATASTAAAFDASKNLVSVTNTGTGNNVLSVSPTFTGTPTVPTAAPGTNTTQAASTAFVTASNSLKSDLISNYKIAYVDTLGNNGTAILGRPDKPYATITAALAALPISGGKIKVGIGSFTSPSSHITLSNLIIEGSGMPVVNGVDSVETLDDEQVTITPPTRLVGGTILKGTLKFRAVNNIQVLNLGTDIGTDYISGGGTTGDGLSFTLSTTGNLSATVPFMAMKGIQVRNFVTLNVSATELNHGVLVENAYEPVLDNVHTYYAVHGIAIKSIGGTMSNIFTHGHGFNGIIIKSDNYAYSSQINLTKFRISSIGANDGGGINIQTEAGNHTYIKISNGIIYRTKFGIQSVNAMPENVDIDNVSAIKTIGYGFWVTGAGNFVKISNSLARGNLYDGFHINASAAYSLLSNNSAIENGGDGFETSSGVRADFENVLSVNNTGYGIRASSNVYGGSRTLAGNTAGATTGTILDRITSFTNLTLNGTTAVVGPVLGNGLTWTDNVNNTGYLGIRSTGATIGADNELGLKTAGTEKVTITTTGVANYTSDVSGSYTSRSLVDKAYVDAAVGGVSGTYTPTFTNNTNITSSSIIGSATYSLTGNIMHVSMAVSVDPVAASTTTVLYFTRPSGYDTASTVSNGNVTSNGFGYGAAQYQSSTLGKMTFTPTSADTQVFFLQFDYEYAN